MMTLLQPARQAGETIRTVTREHVLLAMLDIPRLLRHPIWRPDNPDEGAGQGVLLVPGFGFGDRSMTLAGAWLKARGYQPAGSRIGVNAGCTTELVDRIAARLEQHAEDTGRRVVLIGQSRGGWLARLTAIRRPDLVRGLVMLGSPVLDPLGAHPKVVRVARLLTRLSTLGLPGLMDVDCFTGSCYAENTQALAAPLPPDVPALAVYSREDTIAPWQLCLDPYAECVEIRSTHTGMGLHPDFYVAAAPRLARWARAEENAELSQAC